MRIGNRLAIVAVFVLMAGVSSRAAIIYTSDEGKERHLYSVEPGGKPVQLTKKDSPDLLRVYNMYPAISSDGTRLAYASYRVYVDEGLRLWKQWNGKPVYPTEEFYIYFYSYFPTSTYYTRHKSLNWNIFMKDLKTGQERKISNFLWDEYEPQFLSRGSDILYVLTAETSTFLLRGSKSGKSFKQITLKNNQAIHPQISPNGRTLVYQSYQAGNWELYTLTMGDLPSRRLETRLTASTEISELFPRWAPDGKSIYFIANSTAANVFDLYTMKLETKETKRLTEHASVGADSVMSPKGDKIAFVADIGWRRGLFVINTDGKEKKMLSQQNESALFPVWSPDGKRVAFLSDTGSNKAKLYVVNPDGTGRTLVVDKPCSPSPFVWY